MDYKTQKGAPGALFSNFYDADSACMHDDANAAGGFAIFGRAGEEGTGYLQSASAASAVARVQKIEVTATSAAGAKKVSVTVADKKIEITTTAADAAADVVGDLVSAINGDSYVGDIVTASGSASPLTLTFNASGKAANDIVVEAASEDSGVAVALATSGNIDGADAVPAGFFKGIAIRNAMGLVKRLGDEVAVCRKGKIWVGISGTAAVGDTAYYTAAGVISSSSTSGTAFGKFVTNSENGMAVVELN